MSTDVVLSHDLVCAQGPAFFVTTPGVTVDLGGHTVSVDSSAFCGDGVNVSDRLIFLGPLTILGNVVIGNGGNGITVAGELVGDVLLDVTVTVTAGPVTVKANNVHLNRGQGISAATTGGLVVDGGDNQAFFPSRRPACSGVSCNQWLFPWSRVTARRVG